MMCRTKALTLLTACAALLGGCSTPKPVTELIVKVPETDPGHAPGAPGQVASVHVLEARAAAVDVDHHAVWMSADSTNAGRFDIARSLPPNERGEWVVHRVPLRKGAPDVKKRSDVTLRVDAQGAVHVVQTVEAAEYVQTTFDPPMLMLPPRITPGETVTSAFHMKVHPLGKPDEVNTEGDATNTVACIGHETISTPAGTFETMKVRSVFKALMGNVEVENVTETWFAPRRGIVAETRTQRVTAMGVQVRSGAESWVLAPDAPATAIGGAAAWAR